MHRLWIYVFCSVVIRAPLGVRSSLEKLQKIEDVLPSNEGICIRAEETFTNRSMEKEIMPRIIGVWNAGSKILDMGSGILNKTTDAIIGTSSDIFNKTTGAIISTGSDILNKGTGVILNTTADILDVTGDVLNKTTDVFNKTTEVLGKTTVYVKNSPEKLKSLNLSQITTGVQEMVKSPFTGTEVCFDILGCFSMQSPWKSVLRPIAEPMTPEEINATVDFFSPENLDTPINIKLYPELNLEGISFNPNRTTVFIVHGFSASGHAPWLSELKTAYLKVKDANVFRVDWGGGSQKMCYLKVAGNTRVVGKELALLIWKLIKDYGAQAKDFHLIGHSLGSHICSYAAKEVPEIGRLTALDPAQPGFEGFSQEVRLDKSDATFVEVLHTHARPFIPTLGFGMIKQFGHVDFYFNGGFSQPGCFIPDTSNITVTGLASLGKIPVEVLFELVACPHTRAYQYFTESLEPKECTFWGRQMNFLNAMDLTTTFLTQGALKVGRFKKCTQSNCIPVGLSSINSTLRGTFLVLTGNSPPYCRE